MEKIPNKIKKEILKNEKSKQDKTKNIVLKLEQISKVYANGFQAVFGMDIEIEKGEFIVFVGPSGCGKTTTLRMIAGLEKISNGNLMIKGRNATNLPPRVRNISMVFQNYALFPHLTVRENIAFNLRVRKFPKDVIAKKILWAANVLGLSYVLNRKPAQLSGGQRQRVALGRAMVSEPTLFLMDEPLSNLDAKLRAVMRSTIKNLHQELNTTSIYVTHDQVEAMTMADRIVVMSDGFIQQVGTPREVYENPTNIFVASFIGTPSINLIEGVLEKGKFVSNSFSIKISNKIIKLESTLGQVVFGIRPQHISPALNKSASSIKAKVIAEEMLGTNSIITAMINGQELKYMCDSFNSPKIGDIVYLEINKNKIQLFDKETTLSISNKINETSMKSLNIWNNSKSEIIKRSELMEKEKNSKNNIGFFLKIKQRISEIYKPMEIMLNPEIMELKSNIRILKEEMHQAKRRANNEEIIEIRNKIEEAKEAVTTKTNELKIIVKKASGINKKMNIVNKLNSKYTNESTSLPASIIPEMKNILTLNKKIVTKFGRQFIYEYDELELLEKSIDQFMEKV